MPFRLILETAPGRVDTGATYEGCSSADPDACMPVQFASVAEAVDYAYKYGEMPMLVNSAEEAFAIAEGRLIPDESKVIPEPSLFSGISTGWWIAGAAALMFLLRRK